MLDRTAFHRELARHQSTRRSEGIIDDPCATMWNHIWTDAVLRDRVKRETGVAGDAVWIDDQGIFPRELPPPSAAYEVIGIDGSQIFSDHHAGFRGYVIQIAACRLNYQSPQPGLCRRDRSVLYEQGASRSDADVSSIRTCAERAYAFAMAARFPEALVVADGGIPHVIDTHAAHSAQCCCNRPAPPNIAGYVSAAPSTWLHRILTRAAHAAGITCEPTIPAPEHEALAHCTQAFPVGCIGPWQPPRTIAAIMPDKVMWYWIWGYGEHAARIELSASLAAHEQAALCALIVDQMRKGHGYPVTLAEAHHAAVITEADRQYVLAHARTQTPCTASRISPKLQRKQRMYV